jgi:hypothetical protein
LFSAVFIEFIKKSFQLREVGRRKKRRKEKDEKKRTKKGRRKWKSREKKWIK